MKFRHFVRVIGQERSPISGNSWDLTVVLAKSLSLCMFEEWMLLGAHPVPTCFPSHYTLDPQGSWAMVGGACDTSCQWHTVCRHFLTRFLSKKYFHCRMYQSIKQCQLQQIQYQLDFYKFLHIGKYLEKPRKCGLKF